MAFDGTFGFSEIVTACAIVVGAFWFVKSGIANAVTHDECDERREPLQAHVSKLQEESRVGMAIINGNIKRIADRLPHNPHPIVMEELPWRQKD